MQNKLLDIFDDLMIKYQLYEHHIRFEEDTDNFFFPDNGPHPIYWLEQNKFGYETSHGLIEYYLDNNLQPIKILFHNPNFPNTALNISDIKYPKIWFREFFEPEVEELIKEQNENKS